MFLSFEYFLYVNVFEILCYLSTKFNAFAILSLYSNVSSNNVSAAGVQDVLPHSPNNHYHSDYNLFQSMQNFLNDIITLIIKMITLWQSVFFFLPIKIQMSTEFGCAV